MPNCWRWPIFLPSVNVRVESNCIKGAPTYRPCGGRGVPLQNRVRALFIFVLSPACVRVRERGVRAQLQQIWRRRASLPEPVAPRRGSLSRRCRWGRLWLMEHGVSTPLVIFRLSHDQALCKPCSMFTLDRGSPCFTHNVWPNIMERQPRGEGVRARARSGYSLPTSMGKGSRRFHTFGKFCS
jgi:hypothetical protein